MICQSSLVIHLEMFLTVAGAAFFSILFTVLSFGLGTGLGDQYALYCDGSWVCCQRVLNTSSQQIIQKNCVLEEACLDGNSKMCRTSSGNFVLPSVCPNAGWWTGIVSATVFWSLAHASVFKLFLLSCSHNMLESTSNSQLIS